MVDTRETIEATPERLHVRAVCALEVAAVSASRGDVAAALKSIRAAESDLRAWLRATTPERAAQDEASQVAVHKTDQDVAAALQQISEAHRWLDLWLLL